VVTNERLQKCRGSVVTRLLFGATLLVVSLPGRDEEQHADIVRDGTLWRAHARDFPALKNVAVVSLEFAGKRPILASRVSTRAPRN